MSDENINQNKVVKVKDHKLLPEASDEKMTTVEKIIAHYEQGYFLDDRALKYAQKLEMVFHAVFNYKTKSQCVRIVMMQQRCNNRQAYQLLEDVQTVYGNFFEVNKAAKRYLSELKLMHIHDKALLEGDLEQARLCIGEINRLYDLHNPEEGYSGNKNRKLPSVRRTSNPEALKNLHESDE